MRSHGEGHPSSGQEVHGQVGGSGPCSHAQVSKTPGPFQASSLVDVAQPGDGAFATEHVWFIHRVQI